MKDPHVEALHYIVKHGGHVDYDKAPPTEHRGAKFTVRVADGKARVDMRVHCASIDEARRVTEPFLRTWELSAALQRNVGEFELVFERGNMIDRSPPSGLVLIAGTGSYSMSGGSAVGRIGRASYPAPPKDLWCDAEVDLMYSRYVSYRSGRANLADAAYFCLTVIENKLGPRSQAAASICIDKAVLQKVGELTGEKGGSQARKAKAAMIPYTEKEVIWLEAAMKMLIRRMAERASNKEDLSPISISDLPALT